MYCTLGLGGSFSPTMVQCAPALSIACLWQEHEALFALQARFKQFAIATGRRAGIGSSAHFAVWGPWVMAFSLCASLAALRALC